MSIKTHLVKDRRAVHYETLDELLADAEGLVRGEVRTVGNWSLAQILDHLTKLMVGSIDGFQSSLPWPVRMVAKFFFKKRFLKKGVPPGFKIPANAKDVLPEERPVPEAIEAFRRAIRRLQQEDKRAHHPVFGKMSKDEWTQLHLRHAELHLSFVFPAADSSGAIA